MTGFSDNAGSSWEEEGARLSPLLDDVYATVIAGTDTDVAASIAIGIARSQGMRRRVAIADLVGESPPLEALLTGDDVHGIADSFLYGVSLNKIARPIDDNGAVFLMPSGTESVANEHVYANERWRRLSAGFHQVGALLLIVAAPGTPGFAELCEFVGAIMPVGATTFPMPPGVRLIAPAAPPPPFGPFLPTPKRESTARARAIAAENDATRRRRMISLVLGLAAVAVVLGIVLKPYLPAPLLALFSRAPASVDTTSLARSPVQVIDSLSDAARAAAQDSAAAVVESQRVPLEVANPGDSVRAARYAIYFASANNLEAAMPDALLMSLPGVAVSIVPEDGLLWYRVTIGASTSHRVIATMLGDMRRRKVIGSSGDVLDVPFAFRLADNVRTADVPDRIAEYNDRGIMAYALRQPDGQSVVFTGAFETPMQANVLADSLQKVGITPVLVYRTGRAY